jgi:methyltransferase
MIISVVILGLVTAQRLGELVLANRNTRALKAKGALEFGARHYPLIVILHACWLIGLWILAWNRPVVWPWLWAFLVLQALRVWVIASLGSRWTTRIIVLDKAPRVVRGPYRFVPHPNYLVVVGEIAVLPVAFGLPVFAIIFTLLNAGVLTLRIRAENRALALTAAS